MSFRALRLVFGNLLSVLASAVASASPTGSITSPASQATLSNLYVLQNGSATVNVMGSAGSTTQNFYSWTLSYAQVGGSVWAQIGQGTTKIANGVLSPWDTLNGPFGTNGFNPNGDYKLRLTVCESQTNCVDVTTVTPIHINNVYLEQTFTAGSSQLNLASPTDRATYTVRLPLSWPTSLSVQVNLMDQLNNYVKSVGTLTSASSFTYAWDGTNTGGAFVADGPYFVTASVTDGTNTLNWDQTTQFVAAPDTGGSYAYYDNSQTFDPWTGDPVDLAYNFGYPGRVTISMAGGTNSEIPSPCPPPNGFCIIDHQYEESGPHSVPWAGVDLSGRYKTAGDVKYIAIFSERDHFSKNAVVVYGGKPSLSGFRAVKPATRAGSSVAFTFTLMTPLTWSLQVQVVNQESATLLRTFTTLPFGGGGNTYSINWDGKADNGMWAAPGGYTVTLVITDSRANVVRAQALAYVQY